MSKIKIMAVSSGGGHWKQLCQLKKFFINKNVDFVCTDEVLNPVSNRKVYLIPDSNKNQKMKTLLMFVKTFFVFIKVNPSIIITTGAAPGLAMIFWGWIFRRKTIWIDSIANAEQMSLSGFLAKKIATLTLSQWENVAMKNNVSFLGRLV